MISLEGKGIGGEGEIYFETYNPFPFLMRKEPFLAIPFVYNIHDIR